MGRDWLEHAPEAPKDSDPNLLGFIGRVGFVCRDCMFRMSGRGCNTNALATGPVYAPTILKTFCVFCGPRSMTDDEKKCADNFFLSRFYHQPEPTPDEKIRHLNAPTRYCAPRCMTLWLPNHTTAPPQNVQLTPSNKAHSMKMDASPSRLTPGAKASRTNDYE